MPRVRHQKTGAFVASKADGTTLTISIFSEQHLIGGDLSEPDEWTTVARHLKDPQGNRVNKVAVGQYEILDGWQKVPITSSDPEAP